MATRKRGIGRPFVKGVSGNPSGRPAYAAEFREKCREFALSDGFAQLLELTKSPDRAIRLRALEFLINHGIGKPPEKVELSQERMDEYVIDMTPGAE